MSTKSFRLTAAALSAMALVGVTAASPAFAEDTAPSGTAPTAPLSLIVDDATNTLHITKYLGTPTGATNDGTPIGGTAGTALEGVTFTIYQVNGVDLKTNEGWTAANAYYDALANGPMDMTKVTKVDECTTNASGQCDLSGLPNGLYYVEETSAPAGVTMSKPFLVTLPMTDPDGPNNIAGDADDRTSWMYDVYVYPKNTQDTITKDVVDKGTVTTQNGVVYGDAGKHLVDYVITSSITDGTDPLGEYVVYDQLDPAVTYQSVKVALSDGTTLTAGTDYTVSTTNGLVTVTMTPAGLAILEAHRSASVVTTISAALNAEDADGIVPNTASFIPNQAWDDQNTGSIPSNEVLSKYGDLQITKVDPATATKLAGAVFAVYADANNDEACTAADVVDANLILKDQTTGSDGLLTIKGLQTSDFYNNATQTDLLTYCLVETQAPAGYNLQADPMKFTISQTADKTLAVTPVTVNNEKQNLNNSLPLTGGEGTAAMSIGGLALVAGGVGYYFAAGRRRRNTDNA